MSANNWSWLAFKPQTRQLSKGETLFSQGEAIQNMHVISRGRVKLIRYSADGDVAVLHIATAGEMIAEASFFSDNYHCSAIADLACDIQIIDRDLALRQILDDQTKSHAVLALFARQIRDLRGLIETRNIRSAQQRILAYLNSIADSDGRAEISFTVRDMAYKLGLAHETVYRELRMLEQSGRLKRGKAGAFYL